MKTIKILANGELEGTEIQSTEIETAVGGDIEVVPLPTEGDFLIVDEEGRLKGKPLNKMATLLARRTIVGDALIVSKQGEDFGDADPELALIVTQLYEAQKGRYLRKYDGPPKIRIDSSSFRSKEKELAVRSIFNEENTMDELQAMICVCENELLAGVPLCEEDLLLYCTAMHNLIEVFSMQMTENQKRLYKKLAENSRVTAVVQREEREQ